MRDSTIKLDRMFKQGSSKDKRFPRNSLAFHTFNRENDYVNRLLRFLGFAS